MKESQQILIRFPRFLDIDMSTEEVLGRETILALKKLKSPGIFEV